MALCLVLCAWFFVLCSLCLVRRAWFVVLGAWCLVLCGSWFVVWVKNEALRTKNLERASCFVGCSLFVEKTKNEERGTTNSFSNT